MNDLIARFEQAFGGRPTHAAMAPGRVNLIGEHTDYNGGLVLPMAIDRQVTLLAAPRKDTTVRLRSTQMNQSVTFDLSQRLTPSDGGWDNYVKGPIAGCMERGLKPPGFDVLLDSTVPVGGGLSSSAAIEVATATLIESLTGQTLDPLDKALLCQHAEHTFAGVSCGIMDQLVVSCGRAGHALLIDCRSHTLRPVPFDDPDVSILIINSNVAHRLAAGEYAKRRSECEQASALCNVTALRDVTLDQLRAQCQATEPLIYRRAQHVIREIERTKRAASQLEQRDYVVFGQLMVHSHNSLRDDFEVSCKELDLLVDLTMQQTGVFGSRMTGGGFGGCTVTLVLTREAEAVQRTVCTTYHQRTGLEPISFISRPTEGARIAQISGDLVI